MSAYKMMLSESKERMQVVAKKGKKEDVEEIFNKWELHSAVIGSVTDDNRLRILHQGEVVAEIPADKLAEDAPVYCKPDKVAPYCEKYAILVVDTKDSLAILDHLQGLGEAASVIGTIQRGTEDVVFKKE